MNSSQPGFWVTVDEAISDTMGVTQVPPASMPVFAVYLDVFLWLLIKLPWAASLWARPVAVLSHGNLREEERGGGRWEVGCPLSNTPPPPSMIFPFTGVYSSQALSLTCDIFSICLLCLLCGATFMHSTYLHLILIL